MAKLADQFKFTFPNAKWVTYEPISDENIFAGIELATGKDYVPTVHLEKAHVILSLESDFLQTEAESISNALGFSAGRRVQSTEDVMNRLYVLESQFSVTGSMADHRLRLQSRLVGAWTARLALELLNMGLNISVSKEVLAEYSELKVNEKWLKAVATDLLNNQGKCLIIAGSGQPAALQSLVVALNFALGNVGKTVNFRERKDSSYSRSADLQDLIKDMKNGAVKTLAILGGNPVYNTPADLDFKGALKLVPNSLHLSLYYDETSRLSNWHLPQAHFLEYWGDARSVKGTLSLIQPLIQPLFAGHSSIEILNLIITGRDISGYEIVRDTWQSVLTKTNFEKQWRKVLHDGMFIDEIRENIPFQILPDRISDSLKEKLFQRDEANDSDLEIVFRPSPSVYDGRFSNNGWLQELPDSCSKIAWGNAAHMSPATAKALSLENEELVTLSYDGRELDMPVWIIPGFADFSITIHLGYGREFGGRVADNIGFNTFLLKNSRNTNFDKGLTLKVLGKKYKLANAQDHWSMEGRPIIREATLKEYQDHPGFAEEMVEHPPLKNLWTEHKYDKGHQWGMTIDLNACIGCNACTIACQSENNIPIVGKEQVGNGREMHWIRLDRYFTGSPNDPQMVFQPVACQQCENAPCEQVCPVAATVHSKDGLNVMTYNRCIGTRYCSNNCPYKARRFNFFNYTSDMPEIVKMAQNPDVSVRSRGVMEKCTYCLQRINSERIKAKSENRDIHDGDIKTACQQACPTRAIEFGDINDSNSRVSQLKKNDRKYELLAEFNTRPRTSFLAKLRNPNPELGNS